MPPTASDVTGSRPTRGRRLLAVTHEPKEERLDGCAQARADALTATLDADAMGEFDPPMWIPYGTRTARRGSLTPVELTDGP